LLLNAGGGYRSAPCPRWYKKGLINTDIIKKYYKNGYSLLPIKKNSKLPCIKWKQYQAKRPDFTDILDWYIEYDNPNIALVTGDISNLTVIDVDDPSILPELIKEVPEINETTRVKTKRGYHFYFSGNGINSTNNLLNMGVELKSNGYYVVAPPSIIDDFNYTFEVPLSEILSLPNYLIEKEGHKTPNEEYKKRRVLRLPRYNGLGVSCIGQILSRDLEIGERDNSLFILYNLLLQNRNTEDHSKKIVSLVNNSLTKSLTEKEVNNIFKKAYNFKCSTIRKKLSFIDCSDCKYKFKGGKLGMKNIIVQNLRNLDKLNSSEQRILLFLGSYFEGENPSLTALSNKVGMHFNTAKKAVAGLKEKGIIK